MSSVSPRAVFVIRETDYELLLARHATRGQARFFLETRGEQLEPVEERHERFGSVLHRSRLAVPGDWRQALVRRADLDRFLFGPEDVIVAVGQDGLVANVAKYLAGQPVLGVNAAPDLYDGVLARLSPDALPALLPATAARAAPVERRTLVEATLDTGERLLGLNEVFVGHRGHQSARYALAWGTACEEQSSSGLIVATGTGATGWARSIADATGATLALAPAERAVAFLTREPFPSRTTGTAMRMGKLVDDALIVTSHMNDGGVVFADGVEQDFLGFDWGRRLTLGPAPETLNLVTG